MTNPASVPETVPSTDGVTIAVHDLGGSGPPLLLCHATGFCGRVWEPFAEAVAAHFHCITFDFRAHGESTRPVDRAMEWDGMAEDVLAVIAAVSPDRPIAAVGHSMGGAALVLAEHDRPGTVARAWTFEPILFEPPLDSSVEPGRGDTDPTDGAETSEQQGQSDIMAGARRRRAVFSSRDEAYERYAGRPPLDALDRRALRAYVDHGFEDLSDGTVRLRCRPEDEASAFEHHHSRARSAVGSLTMPFAVAAGGDGSAPAQVVREVGESHDNVDLFVYDELGHFGPLQDPDGIAADVIKWMT